MADTVVSSVTSTDHHRPDLEAAVIGEGSQGFRFVLPQNLSPELDHRIVVRRVADWSLLQGGTRQLKPARPT